MLSFMGFHAHHPKFDWSMDKGQKLIESLNYHIAPAQSHQDLKNWTPPHPWHLYLAFNAKVREF